MKLFLDIDGVLLRDDLRPPQLAPKAEEFLQFVVSHFDCYWLTTHCQGDATTAVECLRPFVSGATLLLMRQIKPTTFDVYKTEALPTSGPFFWIDDAPMLGELEYLEEQDLLNCWLEVDVKRDPNSLAACLTFLERSHRSMQEP